MINDSYPKGTKEIAERILKAAEKGKR